MKRALEVSLEFYDAGLERDVTETEQQDQQTLRELGRSEKGQAPASALH